MAIPAATHQAASNGIAALGNWISVHTDAAGTNGANEASGGSYARAQTIWTPNGTGSNNGSEVNIPVPAGTYKEGGIWSANSAGTFVGSAPFSGGNVMVSGTGASIDVIASISSQ